MSVIDAGLRFPHFADVFDHDEILAELRAQIGAKRFTQRAVAKALKTTPPRVIEVLKGTRRIQMREMRPLAQMLGLQDGAHSRVPRDGTILRFLAAARRSLPANLAKEDELEIVAYALGVGLQRLANHPATEDDPVALDVVVDAVADAARHPPTGSALEA